MSGGDRAMQLLSDDVHRFIRASQSIPSFHSAVEEVICNSLDAGSRRVDIYLDVDAFSFEVHDDGWGISYDNLVSVSQWNRTSKDQRFNASYGLKGQALSALEELSNLIIITTPPQCSCTYFRDHRQQISSVGKASSIHAADESGTVVKVLNLFHNLPVRRCSTRKEAELSSIREYIQHMSVLHHSVHWSLQLLCTPNSSSSILGRSSQLHITAPFLVSSSSCLLDLVAQGSVVDRLSAIHGRSIISKLEKAAACTVGGFTVSGLLSPPNATSCHWTKDCQYYFLNQRWMRGKDSVTTYLNQRYPRLVSACSGVLGGGMLPRVSSSTTADDRDRSAHRNRYPCFALQVTCDPSEYDVVLEPDRSFAVFKDEESLMRCVEAMLLAVIEEHVPMERKADLLRAVREASTITHPHGGLQRGVHSMITASHDDTAVAVVVAGAADKVVCNLFHDYSCQSNDNNDYTYEQCMPTTIPAPMSALKRPFAVGNFSPSPSSSDTISAPRPLLSVPLATADDCYMQQSTGKRSSGDRLFASAFFDSSTVNSNNSSFFQLLRFSPNFRSISASEQDDAYQSQQRPSIGSDRSYHLCRRRPSHCFDDSPYSPHCRVRAPSRSTGQQGVREVLDETSVGSLGDMITAVADKHAKPQLELISRKRKAVEHGDGDGDDGDGDGRASKQLRSEPSRGTHRVQSEYAVYVRRVPLLIDIALQEEEEEEEELSGDSPRASASELYGDDEYFDTQVDEDDDDDGSGYERSDRMDGDDVHPCNRPSDSCYPVGVDPFQHSVAAVAVVVPSTGVESLIPHNAEGASCGGRRLSDDFKRRVGSADIITRPPPIPTSAPPPPKETTVASSHTDREVRLVASCLRDRMEALGQADLKYIIARSCNGCCPPGPGVMEIKRRHASVCDQRSGSGNSKASSSSSSVSSCSLCHNSSFLIALDQHAVDERIRYERSLTRLADQLIMTTVSNEDATTDGSLLRAIAVNIPLTLSSRELAIATNRRPLLNSWLYRYRLVMVQEQCGELSEGGGALVLEQVPEVFGVPLLQDDFRDFLLLISDGEALPDELLKPAAVQRVLASKACRGAVMFGDLLDAARCKGLVSELMSCSLPFNCAHGRPSMVPLVDLRPLRAYKLEECRVNRSRRRSRISI